MLWFAIDVIGFNALILLIGHGSNRPMTIFYTNVFLYWEQYDLNGGWNQWKVMIKTKEVFIGNREHQIQASANENS